MSAVDVLGPVAACVGSAMAMSPLLQALRVWQTRSSRDVSLAAMVIFVANSCAWTAYGWAKGDAVVVIPNLIALVCLSLAIGVVVRFRRPLASDLEVAAADAGADAESALVSEARPA